MVQSQMLAVGDLAAFPALHAARHSILIRHQGKASFRHQALHTFRTAMASLVRLSFIAVLSFVPAEAKPREKARADAARRSEWLWVRPASELSGAAPLSSQSFAAK